MITFRHSATADVDAMDKIIKDAVRGLGARVFRSGKKDIPTGNFSFLILETGSDMF